jgi:hypothetical protein
MSVATNMRFGPCQLGEPVAAQELRSLKPALRLLQDEIVP